MKDNLDTLNVSTARFIKGEQAGISIKGSKENINAFCDAAQHSKKLYEALNTAGTSLRDILMLIQKKKDSSRRFKDVTGLSWRL